LLHFIVLLAVIGVAGILLSRQAAVSVWAISFALFSALLIKYDSPGMLTQSLLWFVTLSLVLCSIKSLRRGLVSTHLFRIVSKAMPAMSSTEREALEAGTVSWEGDLFSGAPDFSVLRSAPTVSLTKEEQAFLDGPVNTLCEMIDDWDITHNLTDLPPAIWQFIKDNQFLGKGPDLGITCALIPSNTPGVIKGRRHFPLNTGFMNGPTQGKDVFIPMDYLIGGAPMAGHGWRMLMECLSAGRAIALPSSASGGVQAASLACGAYARVRKQFNQPIAKFEGIEEPLARIAGTTYLIDAALTMAAAAIDHGAKPSVVGAILKYQTTERARLVGLDAMDIQGGKGICLGPNNYLGRGYQSAPIGITVEGANILTRSLIIFGQGAVRCHPYVFQELESIRNNDLTGFDRAFFAHVAFIIANFSKSVLFAWTGAHLSKAPGTSVKRYYQLVHKFSTNLAFLADFSMVVLGGELKRREKLSARLGDMLSCLYLASAVLKRFHEDGEPQADLPLVQWSCQQLFHECETAMQGVITNFPAAWARVALRAILMPLGTKMNKPNDQLGHKLAKILTEPCDSRSRLTRLVFSKPSDNCPLGRLEEAFHKICAAEELERKVMKAVKNHTLKSLSFLAQIEEALQCNILSKSEAAQLKEAELGRQDVIKVDDFNDDELRRPAPEKELKSKAKMVSKDEIIIEIV